MTWKEKPDAAPAVDEQTLTQFLTQVITYIKENPVVVYRNDEQTSELLKNKPFLYTPCQVRANSLCPEQNYKNPNCHICPSAYAAVRIIQQVGPSLGFFVDHAPEPYSGIGTLGLTMNLNRSGTTVVFDVNGDKQGDASFFVNNTRRPSSSRK